LLRNFSTNRYYKDIVGFILVVKQPLGGPQLTEFVNETSTKIVPYLYKVHARDRAMYLYASQRVAPEIIGSQ